MKIYTKYKQEVCDQLELLRQNENPALKNILNQFDDAVKNSPDIPIDGELIQSQELRNNSIVVVFIDLPTFTQYKTLDLQGILVFTKREKKFQLRLPKFSLSVNDVINVQLAIKLGSIINGAEEAYVSILATGKVTPVKVIIPEGIYRSLEGILQIDCFYAKTNVPGRELVLIFDGNSHILSHTMLKVTPGKSDVKLITKDDNQLYMLYHHLYTNIPGVIILDENCERISDNSSLGLRPTQSFLELKEPNQDILKELINSLDRQMIFVEDKLKNCCKDQIGDAKVIDLNKMGVKYETFRKDLAKIENETDKLIVKAFEKRQ